MSPSSIVYGGELMLFTEEQLYYPDPFRILYEAVYLTERESDVLPQTIPVVENSRLQAYIIDFHDARKLAESNGSWRH